MSDDLLRTAVNTYFYSFQLEELSASLFEHGDDCSPGALSSADLRSHWSQMPKAWTAQPPSHASEASSGGEIDSAQYSYREPPLFPADYIASFYKHKASILF